ncbi:hypothetical protein Taro_016082, partial [Colocasia esculenta]|nr:hypothetical protein [Colocasia esculenta]
MPFEQTPATLRFPASSEKLRQIVFSESDISRSPSPFLSRGEGGFYPKVEPLPPPPFPASAGGFPPDSPVAISSRRSTVSPFAGVVLSIVTLRRQRLGTSVRRCRTPPQQLRWPWVTYFSLFGVLRCIFQQLSVTFGHVAAPIASLCLAPMVPPLCLPFPNWDSRPVLVCPLVRRGRHLPQLCTMFRINKSSIILCQKR